MEENIPYRMEKVCSFVKQVPIRSLCLCEVHGCCCLTLRFCHLFLSVGFQCSFIPAHFARSFSCLFLNLVLVGGQKCTLVRHVCVSMFFISQITQGYSSIAKHPRWVQPWLSSSWKWPWENEPQLTHTYDGISEVIHDLKVCKLWSTN